jgi:hypothetical protein
MAQIVTSGPHYWTTAESPGFVPGGQHIWASAILSAVSGGMDGGQQRLQSLTVTAVPMRDTVVQSLTVFLLHVVAEPGGQLTVNFGVRNAHPTSICYGYKWWVAMIVP